VRASRLAATALVASALAALVVTDAGPARAGDDVCTLSPGKTDQAIAAFAPIAAAFTGQPRCVNCHGGVDPFASNTNHAGGKFSPVFVTGPDGSTSVDVNQTFAGCDDCHGALPGWREAPRALFFAGKSATDLCQQQKQRFNSAGAFIGHMDDDSGGTQFIATGFAGTRGLDAVGQGLVDHYHPEPPVGLSHGTLMSEANAWVQALGGEFRPPADCGCAKHHYQLKIDLTMQIIAGPANYSGSGSTQFPLTFADDGSFSGTGQANLAMSSQMMFCATTMSTPFTWTVQGTSTSPSPEDVPILHMKTTWSSSVTTGKVVCTPPMGPGVTKPVHAAGTSSRAHASSTDSFDMAGAVGNATTRNDPPPYQRTVVFTIVQTD
jgi:hypothetical protein